MRDNPDLGLVVLAKHGLVVWGDTAEEAYDRTVAVCNQAAEFVNATRRRRASLRWPERRARPRTLERAARRRCARSCRPCAAPSPRAREGAAA